jgi:hypothetical protein
MLALFLRNPPSLHRQAVLARQGIRRSSPSSRQPILHTMRLPQCELGAKKTLRAQRDSFPDSP